ncbi:MAG: OmpA family protein, partial [Cryomorphaceae bacterium]
VDESGFKHHYYTMLSEEEPGIPYELHSIVFTSGSSELSGSNDELDQLARELLESPEIQIKIDGHTDDVGDAERNQRLSLKRAETIKAYLVTRGVPSQRVSCEGFGSTKPIAPNTTEKGRNVNRRVEFSILE